MFTRTANVDTKIESLNAKMDDMVSGEVAKAKVPIMFQSLVNTPLEPLVGYVAEDAVMIIDAKEVEKRQILDASRNWWQHVMAKIKGKRSVS